MTKFWVLKLTGCFYSSMTFNMSKDQGNFGFSVHDPFKGLVHPKMKIMSLITHPHVVPNLWELCSSSEHNLRCFWWNRRAIRPSHRQQHNWNVLRSRNVVNTSVKQSMWHQWLNFSLAMLGEYFFYHSSPPSYVFWHFREYHNAYTRCRLSVNNDTQITFMHALSPPNVNNDDYVKCILRYSPKWRKTQLWGEEWLSKLFLFSLRKKKVFS